MSATPSASLDVGLASSVVTPSLPQTTSPEMKNVVPYLSCDFCQNILCKKEDLLPQAAATFGNQVYTYNLDILGDEFPVYSATNPSAVRFDVARVSCDATVGSKLIACTSTFSDQHSWFPPHYWNMASCGSCGRHVGWGFAAVDEEATARAISEVASRRLNCLRRLKDAAIEVATLEPSAGDRQAGSAAEESVPVSQPHEEDEEPLEEDADDLENITDATLIEWLSAGAHKKIMAVRELSPEALRTLKAELGGDESLVEYWGCLPPALRTMNSKVFQPMSFVGLIVTKCIANEEGNAQFVADNIAKAPERFAENVAFAAERDCLFEHLRSHSTSLVQSQRRQKLSYFLHRVAMILHTLDTDPSFFAERLNHVRRQSLMLESVLTAEMHNKNDNNDDDNNDGDDNIDDQLEEEEVAFEDEEGLEESRHSSEGPSIE